MEKIRIVIYEDNNRLRESLKALLNSTPNFKVVADFDRCVDVQTHIEKFEPDVVLMDIDMPEMIGIDGVKKIREKNSELFVIMLTVFDDSENVYKALYAGANGYLSKKNISDKLVLSIKDVMDGGAPMSSAIARMIMNDVVAKGASKSAADYNLTTRELDVLESLSRGNSYKMVADDLFISIDTVRSHIRGIYQKLHVQSQGEAIGKALREGLIK